MTCECNESYDCGCKRKPFERLSPKENCHFLEDGKEIFLSMKKKYPKDTIKDLDSILNALCAAITCLKYANVKKEDYKNFLHLVWKILNDN